MSVCRTGRLQGVDVIGALTELQVQPHLAERHRESIRAMVPDIDM
jgi:hypothetical protein